MLYTPKEVATMLGITVDGMRATMKRMRLKAEGNGKARRLTRSMVETLLERSGRGKSIQTTNYYLAHVKAFAGWLVKDRRMQVDPFGHLTAGNTSVDRRHDRRELEVDVLRSLLNATLRSERTFRGLSGDERFHLYVTACGTGFRASALGSLRPESFDLDGEMPTVTLAARNAKNRKTKVHPISDEIAEALRDFVKGKSAGKAIWGGTWAKGHRAAEMLRIDLEAAGIPYETEGPDGPLFADFHSLRHSYLTLLGRGGVDLRTAQELAGHSTPVLTARYLHRRLHDLAGAAEKLPSFLPTKPQMEASKLQMGETNAPAHVGPLVGLFHKPEHSGAPACTADLPNTPEIETTQPSVITEGCVDLHRDAPTCTKVSDGIRTRDTRNHNPVL